MADVFFISETKLKELSGVDDNMDFKRLKPTIIAVQDIYIQKILGTNLYNDLKTKLTADVTLATNPNEKLLLDEYIAKVVVWYVKMESSLDIQFQYTNKAVMTKSGENAQPVQTSDLKYIMNQWRMNAERYSQLLTDYLIINEALFPKYTEASLAGMNPIQRNYTNGIYMRNNYGENDQCQKGANGSIIIID
jgi:hypothetical protein